MNYPNKKTSSLFNKLAKLGYQPAQKWLKDRKGRELSTDDIEHYSKIVLVLEKTESLMKEIDKIKFL